MRLRIATVVVVAGLAAGCGTEPPQGGTVFQPSAAMQTVLAERQAMHAKRPYNVYIDEAQDTPSVTDAAQAIRSVAGLPAPNIEIKQVDEVSPSGATGPLGATLYRPANVKNTPVIIFFPGVTWATGGGASGDETARQLSLRTGWVVLSIRTSLAPDAQFPAIHDDAIAAFQWARAQLRAWGADPTRVVLAGEGPGANLALSTALTLRDQRASTLLPDQLLLVTPWAGTSTGTPSMSENEGAQPLSRHSVRWAQREYASGHLDDPRIDLASRTDLQGMPPTTIILAQIDPMRSSGEALAAHLQAAGVRTQVRTYPGVTADFFGLGAYVPDAAQAEADATTLLQRGFNTSLARR